jgi:hypothetical protein
MKCDVDKIISGSPEKKYHLIKFLKKELEKIFNKEVQIYLVISERERNDFFKLPQIYLNTSSVNVDSGISFGNNENSSNNEKSFMDNLFNKGYLEGELTLPYKHFYNYFEVFFNRKKSVEIDKEQEKDFLNNKIKKGGGDEVNVEKKEDEIKIEKFLFYTYNKDMRIRCII